MMSKIIVSAHVDVRIVNETTQDRCASEPPEQVLMNERTEIIAALIDRLPPASKEALCLRILDDLSMEAAALEARCSKQTLRKRLQRARQSLLRSLRRLGL
jgi:RNA polymerase sigma factor (sigma-70 family)